MLSKSEHYSYENTNKSDKLSKTTEIVNLFSLLF